MMRPLANVASQWKRKLGDGYSDTLDQSDWCLMFLFCQACISLLHLPDPRAMWKTVFEGQILQRCLVNWFKRSLCWLVQHQGKVTRGGSRLLGLGLYW